MDQTPVTKTATCEKHGDFVSTREAKQGSFELWTHCPTCDAGRQERYEEEERKRKEYELQAKRRMLLAEAFIPPRFEGLTFDDFKTDTKGRADARTAVERLMDGALTNLILSGAPGTGKTMLGCIAVLEMIRYCLPARYVTHRQFIRAMRSTWDRDADLTETQMLRRFTKQNLLVLDEVGSGAGTDAEREMLLELLDLRYRAELSTIVITNLNKQRLTDCIGERAIDRLREGGELMVMNWKSARGESNGDRGLVSRLKSVPRDEPEEREPRKFVV